MVEGAHEEHGVRPLGAAVQGALACVVAAASGWAAEPDGTRPEWPQWRGPRRDGKSTETGLLKAWSRLGPPKLWTARGIGDGFASVAVAGGRIYTAGSLGTQTVVTALDLDGRQVWQTANGPAYRHGVGHGARGMPTVEGGRLYYESPHARVACLEAATGKAVWTVDLMTTYGGRQITWGLAESVLLDGDRVICCPGGPEAAMVALDKATGKARWVCKGTGDKAGYASPILVDHGGLRQVVTMTADAAIGVHADTGELLWRFPHGNERGTNCPTPIHHGGHLFICTGARVGGVLLRMKIDGQKAAVEEVWRTKELDNHHGGVVRVDGHLYGSAHRFNKAAWVCLEFATGKDRYIEPGVGKGSVIYADGMLYTLSEKGVLGLVPATPERHEIVSRFKPPQRQPGPYWAHPVICDGRLYLRHHGCLHAYGVRAEE